MKKLLFALLPALILSCSGGYTIIGTAPEGVDSVRLVIRDTAEIINETVPVYSNGDINDDKSNRNFEFSGKLQDLSKARIYMLRGQESPLYVSFVMFNENITINQDTSAVGGLSVQGNIYETRIKELVESVYSSDSDDSPFILLDSLLSLNPADDIVPFLFSSLRYYISLSQYDSIMAKVDPSQKNNAYFVASSESFECLRNTDIGKQYTDFTCSTADGQPLQLSSLAGKGNWLFVDFWASWCGPCRRENPNVVAAYRKFHDKGFDILGVSLDNDSLKWNMAIEKDSLTWSHVSDLKGWDSPAAGIYGIMAIPANILIDPDGIIAARNLYGEDLEKFLSEKLD